MKTKIAIACQGGGSLAAFTAGALQALFENGIQDTFDIVSLSGTSGGAICAALTWYSLKKGENPSERLANFWQDKLIVIYFFQTDPLTARVSSSILCNLNADQLNAAQTSQERLFNDATIKTLELAGKGVLPKLDISPSSPTLSRWLSLTATALGLRSQFSSLQKLLEAHIDFQGIAFWEPQPNRPILVMGAINVLNGKPSTFNSADESPAILNSKAKRNQ